MNCLGAFGACGGSDHKSSISGPIPAFSNLHKCFSNLSALIRARYAPRVKENSRTNPQIFLGLRRKSVTNKRGILMKNSIDQQKNDRIAVFCMVETIRWIAPWGAEKLDDFWYLRTEIALNSCVSALKKLQFRRLRRRYHVLKGS